MFYLNETSKSLVSYKNMSIVEKVDADRNKERLDILMDMEGLGYDKIEEVIDVGEGVITVHIPTT